MTGLQATWLISSVVLAAALIALSVHDLRTHRLPDWLTLPLIPAGWLAAWLLERDLTLHVLGAAIGYGAFVLLELAYKALRGRAGLGRGDAKMLAAGGAWCGALALPVIVLIASASGLVCLLALHLLRLRPIRADQPVAFGPFLALAIACYWAGLSLVMLR